MPESTFLITTCLETRARVYLLKLRFKKLRTRVSGYSAVESFKVVPPKGGDDFNIFIKSYQSKMSCLANHGDVSFSSDASYASSMGDRRDAHKITEV